MKDRLMFQISRSSWYLALICLGLLAGSVVLATSARNNSGGRDAVEAADEAQDEEGLSAAVQRYEYELRYNRGSSDTPKNLFRLANLYHSRVRNFERAALYYEALLQEFPSYFANENVYPKLAECYMRQGDTALERQTYRRMLDFYPEDSEEHAFARMRLGL